jgi:hypothetical protein
LTRELPPRNATVTYSFEGPISNIYATLAVRLVYSGLFVTHETWRNGFQFVSSSQGKYSLQLREIVAGRAEIDLTEFEASEGRLFESFDSFVHDHLSKRALPESVARTRQFVCGKCNTKMTQDQVDARRSRGFAEIGCPVCGTQVSIVDRPPADPGIADVSRRAAENRDRQIRDSLLHGKIESGFYDVFLAYNSRDRDRVMALADQLRERGIRPWIDVVDLQPGTSWADALPDIIERVGSAAVCVGPNGTGPWEKMEIQLLLNAFVTANVKVIPVLLEGTTREPDWNRFLDLFHRVDFRDTRQDPVSQLIFGITGRRPDRG